MVLTGYVTHDLVAIHHRHCKNAKLVFTQTMSVQHTQIRRGRRNSTDQLLLKPV